MNVGGEDDAVAAVNDDKDLGCHGQAECDQDKDQ